jgi:hypothetical protein
LRPLRRIKRSVNEASETYIIASELRALLPEIQNRMRQPTAAILLASHSETLLLLKNDLDVLQHRSMILEEVKPRLQILDELGPRLQILDELGVLLPLLRDLVSLLPSLQKLEVLLNIFGDSNHAVSETVRVDVETISALALQMARLTSAMTDELEVMNSRLREATGK